MVIKETLGEFFSNRIDRFRHQKAITCLGHSLTYGQVDELSTAFACFLHHQLKLEPGEKLAIQLPNLLQYPVAVLGAIKAGIVIVNTNPLYTARELRHQLKDSGARAILVLRGVSSHLAEVLPHTEIEHVVMTQVGDLHCLPKRWMINAVVNLRDRGIRPVANTGFREALAAGQGLALPQHLTVPESLAVLQYTGGTTGVAKGAMLTHSNLLANLFQVREAFGDYLRDGEEIIVAPLPLYHIFAFMLCMLMGFEIGARVILIPDPRNQKQLVSAIKGLPITFFAGLNTLFNALCRNEQFRQLDFSSLRITISGGMALMRDTAETWEKVTGCKVVEGYGLTETSPVVALNPPREPRLGTVGKILPHTAFRLMADRNTVAEEGQPGELVVRGPQVMRGYWQRPEATAEVLDERGWLHTGDVATVDSDGYLRIVDRIKDMIVVSGFNVYPNEIEDELMKHPDIVECAAIGVPDPESVEAVKLFVVSHNPQLTAAAVKEFARQNLTAYKIPRHIEFIDELPKSNVGKVLRRKLKDINT
jgi:long-chain acyl-CoA synthetase